MPKLQALCDCPYGVGVQPKGSTFDATENDAKILVAIGRARRVATPIEPPPAADTVTQNTDRLIDAMDRVFGKPAAEPTVEPAPQDKPKRQYRRRDMTAEN